MKWFVTAFWSRALAKALAKLSKEAFEPHAALYEKGIAVGQSDVKNDLLVFRFGEEVFEFPTIELVGKTEWNGYFYTMKADKLRKLAKLSRERKHG